MVVLCGRKRGFICFTSRLVHLGSLTDELRSKSEAVARISSVLIANTRPRRTLGEVFACAQEACARAGYPDEWRLHHQGGSAGYEAREIVGVPGVEERVALGQAYAWNPSIRGTRSEDTLLVCESGNEILTGMQGWPVHAVEHEGRPLLRPAILEVLQSNGS
jgi:Xaa-Pro dipeptidase